MSFRKRGLELLELMRSRDEGWSAPELRRATGWSRPLIAAALHWLDDCGAVTMKLDEDRRRRWSANPDEDDGDDTLAVREEVELLESLVDDNQMLIELLGTIVDDSLDEAR